MKRARHIQSQWKNNKDVNATALLDKPQIFLDIIIELFEKKTLYDFFVHSLTFPIYLMHIQQVIKRFKIVSFVQFAWISVVGWRHLNSGPSWMFMHWTPAQCVCHTNEAYWWLFELTLAQGKRTTKNKREEKNEQNTDSHIVEWQNQFPWFYRHLNQNLLRCVRHLILELRSEIYIIDCSGAFFDF